MTILILRRGALSNLGGSESSSRLGSWSSHGNGSRTVRSPADFYWGAISTELVSAASSAGWQGLGWRCSKNSCTKMQPLRRLGRKSKFVFSDLEYARDTKCLFLCSKIIFTVRSRRRARFCHRLWSTQWWVAGTQTTCRREFFVAIFETFPIFMCLDFAFVIYSFHCSE